MLGYATHNHFSLPYHASNVSKYLLDRETFLDVTVNIIPLVIIAFFFVLFAISSEFVWDPFIVFISLGLLAIPFVLLALVTYLSGWVIERDEERQNTTEQSTEKQKP